MGEEMHEEMVKDGRNQMKSSFSLPQNLKSLDRFIVNQWFPAVIMLIIIISWSNRIHF